MLYQRVSVLIALLTLWLALAGRAGAACMAPAPGDAGTARGDGS